ncbi:hypothetical protein DEO72_LG2g4514 [Vigna unguiculata]|uniref:Uncharacterized protein n=1 Tax=Vigna unguiculata TaxID=3917 RepID=A0A4D6L6W4_VIGUN|nr:hypothetical protein DEO72_LG2g4514 [Vigna unguiculata]
MLRARRYMAGASHVLDYGRACPQSRTTSGKVRRGKTTSGQVRVSIMNLDSMAKLCCVLGRLKGLGVKGLNQELTRIEQIGVSSLFCILYVISLFISSPFLFVLGDDRVILYTGAVDDAGDATNA